MAFGNMLQKTLVSFDQSQKSIGAEGLHEALHRAKAQLVVELAVYYDSVFDLHLAIIGDQIRALRFIKIDIGIVE